MINDEAVSIPGSATAAEQSSDVRKLNVLGKEVYLIGTAHVSLESVALVKRVIEEVKPDCVAVELDPKRLDALSDPDRWKRTDLYKIVREGNSYLLLTQLVLHSFQKKISTKLGVQPGAEMLGACTAAKKMDSRIECIDREIRITLKRAWARASAWSIFKVVIALGSSIFDSNEVSEEEIERLKQQDVLSAALEEFSSILPDVKTSLIDERDIYMAQKIRVLEGKKIVAVVGAGHVPGILRQIEREHSLVELEKVPSPSLLWRAFGWAFPAIIIGLILAGFLVGGGSTSGQMVISWILCTGSLSAVGAVLCLAHPLTVLVAFIAAPLTTLHPLIGVGWFTGLSEAYFRKPQVADLENVSEDLSHVKGWWTNRVGKVLLVVTLTSLGAIAGSVVGVSTIITTLF